MIADGLPRPILFPRLDYLDVYRTIFVTGPHRAGTRFISKIIASELDRRFIGEEEIGYKQSHRALVEMNKKPCVIHGPGFFPFLKDFDRDDVIFVYVNRPEQEIIKSNQAVGVAANKYTPKERKSEWNALRLKHKTELNYHDFETHPLWVEQHKRDHARRNAPGRMELKHLMHEVEWKWAK